jgi:hypothetical protein
MGIRTTITLDEDVLDRVKRQSQARGTSFKETVNELLRTALVKSENKPRRTLKIKPVDMGLKPGLSLDNIEALLEFAEGPFHR